MKEMAYVLTKLKGKLLRKEKEAMSSYFRSCGMRIGSGCNICSNIVTPESHLIEIGDNVTVGGHVEFVTHDNSISKVLPNCTDLFGKIVVGNNCFIGARSVIMYGVTIPDNVIVAAGSVVTKSVESSNVIVGGNPARVITTWEKFGAKNANLCWNLDETSREEVRQLHEKGIKLVKR